MTKKAKYQPIYMPTTKDKDLLNQPLFDTEKEAWKYIHDTYCHCGIEVHISQKKYCESCEAEWSVDKILLK